MYKMTMSLMAALLAIAFVPSLASASLDQCVSDPVGVAFGCAVDDSFTYGNCNNGFQEGITYVEAFTLVGGAYAEGYSYCYGFSGYSFTGNGVSAGAFTAAGGAGADWYSYGGSFGSGCSMDVYAFTPAGFVYQPSDCVAGSPPNPGWGQLTP